MSTPVVADEARADAVVAADVEALIARLAQPAPTATPFVEERGSDLLATPQRIRGQLRRPEHGTLVREVAEPFVETTTIRGERVSVVRRGQPTRSFSLRRAPELDALLAGFRAMLDGDAGALLPHYTLAVDGDADGGWRIVLTPRSSRLRQRIGAVVLHGRDDALACIVSGGDAAVSRMLVGAAAEAAEPDFDRHCGDRPTP